MFGKQALLDIVVSIDIQKNNTISKLFKILEKEKILQNSKFKIIVKKNIPSKAGLGGGSMNAACVLKFLIKKGFISISRKEVLKIAGLIGSDVIFGVDFSGAPDSS